MLRMLGGGGAEGPCDGASARGRDWFSNLFHFSERKGPRGELTDLHKFLEIEERADGLVMRSKISGYEYGVGRFECPSLAELRADPVVAKANLTILYAGQYYSSRISKYKKQYKVRYENNKDILLKQINQSKYDYLYHINLSKPCLMIIIWASFEKKAMIQVVGDASRCTIGCKMIGKQ